MQRSKKIPIYLITSIFPILRHRFFFHIASETFEVFKWNICVCAGKWDFMVFLNHEKFRQNKQNKTQWLDKFCVSVWRLFGFAYLAKMVSVSKSNIEVRTFMRKKIC